MTRPIAARLGLFALPAGLALLAGCSGDPACGLREAVVDRVIDGDTIVAGGIKVRYLLVNAPEITDGHTDCYGANAAQFNTDLVLGKTVQLDYDVACEDAFGRTLAYVTVGGQDVNRLLIERGYACVLHIPPDGDARAGELTAVQAAARSARRGLWGACDPIPCN
ncbi:MAG TPA: thermonuclease family protein [Kofleriaceae bacterium]|nr:thermonuclease family protein [Kofleriaceae bacterium]